jgi:predicted AAA+ superfamily ATPase
LITGPRQVGKTTIFKQLQKEEQDYVTLDDLEERALAKRVQSCEWSYQWSYIGKLRGVGNYKIVSKKCRKLYYSNLDDLKLC